MGGVSYTPDIYPIVENKWHVTNGIVIHDYFCFAIADGYLAVTHENMNYLA